MGFEPSLGSLQLDADGDLTLNLTWIHLHRLHLFITAVYMFLQDLTAGGVSPHFGKRYTKPRMVWLLL
jgi:hypothetical protein